MAIESILFFETRSTKNLCWMMNLLFEYIQTAEVKFSDKKYVSTA